MQLLVLSTVKFCKTIFDIAIRRILKLRYADAIALAEKQIAAFKGSATGGQVSFCISLIQAAYAGGA